MHSEACVSARLANLSAALREINSMGTLWGVEGRATGLCGGNIIKGVLIYLIVNHQN